MFLLVDRPTIVPARTLLGSTVGPVLDTQVTLVKGRVYLSRLEVKEAAVKWDQRDESVWQELADEAGWITANRAAELLAAKEAEIHDLRDKLAAAESGQPKVVSLDDALKLAAA